MVVVELSFAVSIVGGVLALLIGLLCWVAQRLIRTLDTLATEVRALDVRLGILETTLEVHRHGKHP